MIIPKNDNETHDEWLRKVDKEHKKEDIRIQKMLKTNFDKKELENKEKEVEKILQEKGVL